VSDLTAPIGHEHCQQVEESPGSGVRAGIDGIGECCRPSSADEAGRARACKYAASSC